MGFYLCLPIFLRFYWFYLVLLVFTWLNLVILSFIGFYLVFFLVFIRLKQILPSSTRLY